MPEYSSWSKEQNLKNAKRLEYLKQNPDKMSEADIQRGKNLLHAIDVMDEYSQSNAEDTEVATQMATAQVLTLVSMLGTILGSASILLKPVQKFIMNIARGNKVLEMFAGSAPTVIGMLLGTAVSFPAIIMSTKAKVGASRRGRFEAMNNELKNPAIFAVLTPEQQKKVDELAKDVELDDKDKKQLNKKKGSNFNPAESFKTLKTIYQGSDQYNRRKAEFDAQLKEDETKFENKLTDEQIRNAKRDQQILSNMVRKIDIASQDYAENTELATNTLISLALGTGGLVGWVSNKIMKACKVSGGKLSKFIPWAIGLSIPTVMGIYAAKVQKHASRIARYKTKQEMLNNPAELVYVDDKDYEKMTNVKIPEKAKKPNVFKFFIQLLKDNKEYQNYTKTEGLEQLKRHKVLDKINLTEEQLQEAKNLQKNVFKTFNKVDEKSQSYSESVEAMGQIVQEGVSVFGSLLAMGISFYTLSKLKFLPNKMPPFMTILAKTFAPFALCTLPLIGIDIYTTKAQKKASRVADMLALKELEDYRHYADFSQKPETKVFELPKQQKNNETNLIKRFQA